HLNFPFREPLTPELAPLPPEGERDLLAWQGRIERRGLWAEPYVHTVPAELGRPSARDNERLVDALRGARRGRVVVGPRHCDERVAEPILWLGKRLGFPILADPLSGLRGRPLARMPSALVVSSYDALLRSEGFVERAAPELVLR